MLPYFGVNGFCRYKLFPPLKTKDGTLKYFQPKDSSCHLYIFQRVAEKLTDTLLRFSSSKAKRKRRPQCNMD